MKPLATVRYLDTVADVAADTQPPETLTERQQLLHVVHRADQALDDLHGLCDARPDRHGRCIDCGRLIGWPTSRLAHKRGGCLMAIPFVGTALWLRHNYMSIPFAGKAIWLLGHRGGR